MNEVITIGVDLAKNVFQVHGVDAEGAPLNQEFKHATDRDEQNLLSAAMQPLRAEHAKTNGLLQTLPNLSDAYLYDDVSSAPPIKTIS